MKIVVFGGGGFIGSTIIDRLLKDQHQVRVFERPRVEPYRRFDSTENVEWNTGDMMSVHDVECALEGMDAVMHLVSTTLPKSSNDDPIYDVQSNLVATLQLLNTMVSRRVGRIIFISSGGTVYGNPHYLPVDERHPTEPRVSYGITKLAIEKYLLMYQQLYGIRATILRVANPYGERQRSETAQGAIGVFLQRVLAKQALEIWGDGSVTRDYLHVSDVADAFARAVGYEGDESVFNISSGAGVSIKELIAVIERIVGCKVPCTFHPGRPFDVPSSVLDNSLAKKELGWTVQVGLDEGIVRTLKWMTIRSRQNTLC